MLLTVLLISAVGSTISIIAIIALYVYQSRTRAIVRGLQRETETTVWAAAAMLKVTGSLPMIIPGQRNWAIGGDLLAFLVHHIRTNRPKSVLELGSGYSTPILAQACGEVGAHLFSVDSDKQWIDHTRRLVESAGASEYVTLLHAELKELLVKNGRHVWYDAAFASRIPAIDMMIVDGPPGDCCRLARLPAIPLLLGKLSDDALVVLDDADRTEEREILTKWHESYNEIEIHHKIFSHRPAFIYIRR